MRWQDWRVQYISNIKWVHLILVHSKFDPGKPLTSMLSARTDRELKSRAEVKCRHWSFLHLDFSNLFYSLWNLSIKLKHQRLYPSSPCDPCVYPKVRICKVLESKNEVLYRSMKFEQHFFLPLACRWIGTQLGKNQGGGKWHWHPFSNSWKCEMCKSAHFEPKITYFRTIKKFNHSAEWKLPSPPLVQVHLCYEQ